MKTKFNEILKELLFRFKALTSLNIILIVIGLIILNVDCKNSSNPDGTVTCVNYQNADGFNFYFPKDFNNLIEEDLGRTMRELNPSLTFIALVPFTFGNGLFSVSIYDLSIETTIDSAFIKSVNHKATIIDEGQVDNYELIDYGVKESNDKFLRYKISFTGNISYNIMYYFMKDNYSRYLYELKMICPSQDNIEEVKSFLESVAWTAGFE